jgi:hypothetical protein
MTSWDMPLWRLPFSGTVRGNDIYQELKVNIKVLQWLLKHRDVLLKVVEVAKDFDRNGSYASQWDIIDRVARLVTPIMQAEANAPQLLTIDYDHYTDEVAVAYQTGAEVSALGVDWKLLIEVIVPIIISILQGLLSRTDDE